MCVTKGVDILSNRWTVVNIKWRIIVLDEGFYYKKQNDIQSTNDMSSDRPPL